MYFSSNVPLFLVQKRFGTINETVIVNNSGYNVHLRHIIVKISPSHLHGEELAKHENMILVG